MELEGRLYSVLVRRKDIRQRLRTAGREREDVRDRDELLVSKIDEAKGGGDRGKGDIVQRQGQGCQRAHKGYYQYGEVSGEGPVQGRDVQGHLCVRQCRGIQAYL